MFFTHHLWLITCLYAVHEWITCSSGLLQPFVVPLEAVIVSLSGLAVSLEQDTPFPNTGPHKFSTCLKVLRTWVLYRTPAQATTIQRAKEKCSQNLTSPFLDLSIQTPRNPCPCGPESVFGVSMAPSKSLSTWEQAMSQEYSPLGEGVVKGSHFVDHGGQWIYGVDRTWSCEWIIYKLYSRHLWMQDGGRKRRDMDYWWLHMYFCPSLHKCYR